MLRLYAHYPGITARIAEGEPLPESLSLDGLAGRPPGYVLATRPNRGLLATGLGIWGGAYVLAALGAASAALGPGAPDPAANQLLVPVAGPVLYVASSDREPSGGLMALAILDALVQAGGLAMALASPLRSLRTPYYRRADVAKREASPSTRLRVSIGPRGGGAFWSF